MGSLVSGITQGLGLTADPDAGAGSAAASAAQIQKAVDEIEALDIPDIEKQKLQLALMSEAGFLDAEQMEGSAFEQISSDPRLKDAQMQALEELRTRGEVGLTPEEKQQMSQMRRQAAGDAQSQQASILQGMAQQGDFDSGAQLAAQLSAQQGSYDRAAQDAESLASQVSTARRDALERSANVASSIRGQDFQQDSEAARAKDIINQFNTQNRQNVAGTNLGIRQQDIATQNQQQQFNKGLQQQDFQNRMAKGQMLSNARMGQASNFQQQAQAEAQGAQAQAAGNRGLLMGGAQAVMASDKNVKEGIKPIRNMLDKLKPYEYEYKDDESDEKYTGIMAQDLEKSELGNEYVEEDEDGTKMVDYGKMASTLLASNVDLHRRLKDLEKKRGK